MRDSLGEVLALGELNENDLYAAMDWLHQRQDAIEQRLAKRHLCDGALVPRRAAQRDDLTSSYLEGRNCPLAKRGYSRDGKRNFLHAQRIVQATLLWLGHSGLAHMQGAPVSTAKGGSHALLAAKMLRSVCHDRCSPCSRRRRRITCTN